jgi:glycosyltransferase involved in cell wall biosynthesis
MSHTDSLPASSAAHFAACTIIAKNYLPMARTLAQSWNAAHPGSPFYVLLLDSPQGFFRPEEEPFETILVDKLDIPNLSGFLFKYSILEASTAVKPYLLDYIFRAYSVDKLLYLDPDILIFRPLEPLRERLETANILLTPHLCSPLPNDGRGQTEHDILQAGTYNLGFFGIRNSLESRRLLRWWSDKLYHDCIVSFPDNLFVDQRWMDMAPGLFDGVEIIRDPGFNAAYWNLHERSISVRQGNEVAVNGAPLYFFHFSGFDPNRPWIVSKYQTRFDMSTIGDARKLYTHYQDLLIKNGWKETSGWNYGHNYFANGVRIPASARKYYWSLGPDVAHLGDPFQWLGDGTGAAAEHKEIDRSLAAGVNLLGYFASEKGVGEGARSNLRIIQATGAPYCINNKVDSGSRNVEQLAEELRVNNPYLVNLITLNPDGLYEFGSRHASYLAGHYNIAYWAWELPEFPPQWTSSFGYADEIWTPSRFTRDSVATCSPIPVHVVPHSLEIEEADAADADRGAFGIPGDVFLFLFLFDFHSFVERKNPLGLVEAYKRAFGNRTDVQLLIKSAHSAEHQRELKTLQRACEGANIRIVDAVLTRQEKQNLMKAADCYVSLHRSEGFGLTMAEAMLLGKPVVATGYSGNVDFMSDDDSYLVPYRLVTIKKTHGPYKAGYHWADPDLDSACDMMRYVEGNREAAREMGRKAQAKVRELLHPAAIAASVRARLEELRLLPPSVPAEVQAQESSH